MNYSQWDVFRKQQTPVWFDFHWQSPFAFPRSYWRNSCNIIKISLVFCLSFGWSHGFSLPPPLYQLWISGWLIIDPITWQSGEPKVSSGRHDRKQNVSGWQKHASDLVKAVLVAVVMETEVGGRAVTVPLVEVMSVWHVGSAEVLHCNKASYTV